MEISFHRTDTERSSSHPHSLPPFRHFIRPDDIQIRLSYNTALNLEIRITGIDLELSRTLSAILDRTLHPSCMVERTVERERDFHPNLAKGLKKEFSRISSLILVGFGGGLGDGVRALRSGEGVGVGVCWMRLSMCGCEPQPSFSACLKPPEGNPLLLNEGATWIGRGSFPASTKALLLCSRRQACFKLDAAGLVLECHGINPLLFVVCHSRNVHGTEETPASELFQLQKGEAVELTDGDQFYYAALECLLTVAIKQNFASQTSRDALELALQQASDASLKEKEQIDVEITRELRCPVQDCGTSEPQILSLKNNSVLCASYSKIVLASHPPVVDVPQGSLFASKPSGSPTLMEKPRDGNVRSEPEDSDSLGLDAYDCAAAGIRPFQREEIAIPSEKSNHVELNEFQQIRAENRTEEANANSAADEVLQDGMCPQSSIAGEGCTPLKDMLEDIPCEAPSGQRETQDYNPIMSSETVDGRSIEDESNPCEVVRGAAFGDVGDDPNLNLGHPDDATLSRSPLSGIREECLERLEGEEHPEVSGRASDREDDPAVSAVERENGCVLSTVERDDDPLMSTEDDSWPDGPVDGMESVIASMSGYEGAEKQNLVKLINKTGAAFTGVFSKANTHLVCRSFHGKKFDKAMKDHKVVVNHQWFEDSLQAGTRLSEGPYKLRSGKDVGPLKWKETLPPPVIEDAELSNGAANQHLGDHDAIFWNTIDEEINMDQQGQDAVLETSRQAGIANVEAGHTEGRKLRRLIKRSSVEDRTGPLNVEQENLFRENPIAPASSSRRFGESYQRRTRDFVGGLEQGYNTRRRKSASAALHNSSQGQEHDAKRRKSASSVLERGIGTQEQGAVRNSLDSLTGRGRLPSSVASDRALTVINIADDVEDHVREAGLRVPQATSAQATEGTNVDTSWDRNLQDSQPSQRGREVACAICLVEVKSPSQGLLECGHKFCFQCIFKWAIQRGREQVKVQGPSCPLCKRPIDFITRQEVSSSGKLDETVVVVSQKETGSSTRTQATVVLDHVCIQCGNSDSESLLMRCATCGNRAIHNFCMDPPAPPPWFCPGCMHGHHRDSMRLAWNQFLPGPSTSAYGDSTQVTRQANVRRRNTQPYTLNRRPTRPTSTYRPSLHTELAQSMGPVRRRNVVGQHSLRSWLNNTSNEDS